MKTLRLPVPDEFFRRMPRNAAYRYELIEGHMWLTPRPQYFHCMLDLASREPTGDSPLPFWGESVTIRPWEEGDWDAAVPAFAAAFEGVQPFGSLDGAAEREEAARDSLTHTRTGGDGPVIAPACFAAAGEGGRFVGGCLVTLLPGKDLTGWGGYHWDEPPPADAVERRLGVPHLTWVFVTPLRKGRGVGTRLLGRAAHALREIGYDQMASTFLLGNEASAIWHWRNGFRLLGRP